MLFTLHLLLELRSLPLGLLLSLLIPLVFLLSRPRVALPVQVPDVILRLLHEGLGIGLQARPAYHLLPRTSVHLLALRCHPMILDNLPSNGLREAVLCIKSPAAETLECVGLKDPLIASKLRCVSNLIFIGTAQQFV